ncbi:hypothetical protein BDP27DRAFT_75915 [Rhodocollybia butyracea]|uniref:Uncharacterized protein n=1 Tax=Rhodocollybia butyracea TaxID=206335 RepID=A0A9P5U407_9AGAR|nr:hypothetical protein BDP27DRAFT_75915 [Rhodocollybia butyracea]
MRCNMIPGRNRDLRLSHFTSVMLKYPSGIFPYYTLAWSFATSSTPSRSPPPYHKFHNMDAAAIGTCLDVLLTVGTIMGEFCAARLSDYIMHRMAARHEGIHKPKYRLYVSPLRHLFASMYFGATIGHTGFILPLVGLSISVFGPQICSTCLYSYVNECYKPQTKVLFNFSRGLSFLSSLHPSRTRSSTTGLISRLLLSFSRSYLPVAALIWPGERWRIMAGNLTFHWYM